MQKVEKLLGAIPQTPLGDFAPLPSTPATYLVDAMESQDFRRQLLRLDACLRQTAVAVLAPSCGKVKTVTDDAPRKCEQVQRFRCSPGCLHPRISLVGRSSTPRTLAFHSRSISYHVAL